MSAWLVGAWVAVVLVGAWPRRPGYSPARALAGPRPDRSLPSLLDLVAGLGRVLRTRCGRPADADLDRRLGWSVLAGCLGLVDPLLLVCGPSVWLTSCLRSARRRRRVDDQVHDDTPDVIDLFLLTVDAGCTPRLAVEAVAHWSTGPWATALGEVAERVGHGARLAHALPDAVAPLGDAGRPLVVALLDTEHYGVPLAPSLERLSAEVALERRRRAEERARRVPVKLLFPLVFCTLPAFVLLTVVPLLAGTLPALSP